MLLKTDRLTIRHIIPDDWKYIKEIWVDFNFSALSQYDKPHNTDDEDVQRRIEKWAGANSGTEHMFFGAERIKENSSALICLGALLCP